MPEKKKKSSKSSKKKSEDKVPEFFDIDDKNLRNNFGYSYNAKNEIDDEVNKINEKIKQSYDTTPVYHRRVRRPRAQYDDHMVAKIISYFFVGVIVILLALGAVMVVTTYFQPAVEDGICMVKVKTVEAGDKDSNYVELPGTECSTADDCEQQLLDNMFSEKDVRGMSLKCVESD